MGSLSNPPHIVVFAVPAEGHVNAAVDLSRKLAALGVSITLVCTEARIAHMSKQGFDAGGLPIRLRGLPDSLPDDEKAMAATFVDTVDQIRVSIKVTLSLRPALEDMLARLKSDGDLACLVYDFSLWWVAGVGKELQIPTYIFQPFSSMFGLYFAHIPRLVSEGRLPLTPGADLSDPANMFDMPGLPALHASEVPDISWDPNPVCSFDHVVGIGSQWLDATGMLLNSVQETEKDVIEALHDMAPGMDIKAVGPILPLGFLKAGGDGAEAAAGEALSAAAQACLRWLDEQPAASVLYVAFGTIACLSEEQTEALAMGLEASEQRFLWVVRTPKSQAGPALPRGFEERTRGRGYLLWELAPQRRVLAHPAIGAFLTHNGWNSTLESMCRGVPMICWPMFSDQTLNAKWVDVVAHTGRLLKRSNGGLVSKDEVEGVVRDVLCPAEKPSPLQVAATRARDAACRAALDPLGSSCQNLQQFVATFVKEV